jgi:hypothetical protein
VRNDPIRLRKEQSLAQLVNRHDIDDWKDEEIRSGAEILREVNEQNCRESET